MFRWDKLLRKGKSPKRIDDMQDEAEELGLDSYSGEDLPDDSVGKEDNNEEEYEIVEMEILPTKIICPDCGGITLEGLDFCDKCGGEL
jgi:hypothetical protein